MPTVLTSGDHTHFHNRIATMASVTAVVFFTLFGNCLAQPAPSGDAAAIGASKISGKVPATDNSAWNRLTPLQQQALQPLESSWQTISEAQRRKWLVVSKNYRSLPPAEQVTIHGRMVEWVALSPAQRAAARLNFAKTNELSKQLTPDEKLAKWQEYQALSPSEREKLAAKAGPKPIGGALAVRPVAPQKLVGIGPHPPAVGPAINPSSAAANSAPIASQAR